MKTKNRIIRLCSITLCLCLLAACGASKKWSGETYVGTGTISKVMPSGATKEKFKLTTEKKPNGNQKFITLDGANQVLANCTVPLDDTSDSMEGRFSVVKGSGVVCTSIVDGKTTNITIYAGDVTLLDASKGDATFSVTGIVQGTSQGSVFEIVGKPES